MPRWYRMLLMPKAVVERQDIEVERQSVSFSRLEDLTHSNEVAAGPCP